MPKIAFVSDAIYPYSKGGKEKRLYDITKQLVSKGYWVDIYTMKWWQGEDTIVYEGIHLHALCKNYHLYVGQRRSIRQALLFGLACVKLISKQFDVIDVDQIPFFPLYTVWLVCKLKRKKMHATWHEVWGTDYWKTYLGYSGSIAAALERIAIRLPTKIIAVSDTTSEQIKSLLKRTEKISIIPNSVDFKSIKNVKPSKRHQDVIFAARLLKHKRADLLIRSISLLKITKPDISCLIIGTGPEEIALKQLAQELDITDNILFHDFYENIDDLYALIKSSRVYVLPSEREGFGLGLLEANACGIPAITLNSAHNAAQRIIKERLNGSVVKPVAQDISKAINYWLSHKAHDIQDVIDQYNSEKTVARLLEVYAI